MLACFFIHLSLLDWQWIPEIILNECAFHDCRWFFGIHWLCFGFEIENKVSKKYAFVILPQLLKYVPEGEHLRKHYGSMGWARLHWLTFELEVDYDFQ